MQISRNARQSNLWCWPQDILDSFSPIIWRKSCPLVWIRHQIPHYWVSMAQKSSSIRILYEGEIMWWLEFLWFSIIYHNFFLPLVEEAFKQQKAGSCHSSWPRPCHWSPVWNRRSGLSRHHWIVWQRQHRSNRSRICHHEYSPTTNRRRRCEVNYF